MIPLTRPHPAFRAPCGHIWAATYHWNMFLVRSMDDKHWLIPCTTSCFVCPTCGNNIWVNIARWREIEQEVAGR